MKTGPKYYYIVTFSDGSNCRIDHARGPRPALVAATSQCMRGDAQTIDRYHIDGIEDACQKWNVLPPKSKSKNAKRQSC